MTGSWAGFRVWILDAGRGYEPREVSKIAEKSIQTLKRNCCRVSRDLPFRPEALRAAPVHCLLMHARRHHFTVSCAPYVPQPPPTAHRPIGGDCTLPLSGMMIGSTLGRR